MKEKYVCKIPIRQKTMLALMKYLNSIQIAWDYDPFTNFEWTMISNFAVPKFFIFFYIFYNLKKSQILQFEI